MSTVLYQVKTIHSKKLFEDFVKFTYKINSPRVTMRILIFAMCSITISFYGKGIFQYIFIVVGVALALLALFRHKLGASQLAKTSQSYQKQLPVVFEFRQNDFSVENAGLIETISYKDITEGYEDKKYLYLNVNNEVLHILPKADVQVGDVEELRNFIEKRCKIVLQATKKSLKENYQYQLEKAYEKKAKRAAELEAKKQNNN